MHLIEILLPLADNDGRRFPRELYAQVRQALLDRFGGLTAFSRSPAEGLWDEGDGATVRDNIVLFEVMADELDRAWWHDYRAQLERLFRQDEIVIRAHQVERL